MKAASPLIALVITTLFGMIMVTLTLTVIRPILDRSKDNMLVTEAMQSLPLLDSAITEVASEAQSSKRTIHLHTDKGDFIVNGGQDYIAYRFTPSESMGLTGSRGEMNIEKGLEFVDYFNSYVDGTKLSPTWVNTSGKWTASSGKYRGIGGLSCHHIGLLNNFNFIASITNDSAVGGQVFVLPASQNNLVGYWTFDNGTGSKAYDWSGNLNNGTLSNMNTTGNATSGWNNTDCKFGRCMNFDGVNDVINISTTSDLMECLNGTNLTVSLWVKSSQAWSSTWSPGSAHLIGGSVSGALSQDWEIVGGQVAGSNGKIIVGVDAKLGNYSLNSTTIVNNNIWHHIVFTRIRNGTSKLYVDSVLESSANDTGGGIWTNRTLQIGFDQWVNGAKFNGTLDEIRIWNRTLTADEVTAEYEASYKKVTNSEDVQSIGAKTNVTICLSNPDGQSRFDDIRVSESSDTEQTFIIPYTKIDLNYTVYIGPGDHEVTVEHMGVNSTTNKPIIMVY